MSVRIRHNWTRSEISKTYNQPFLDLIFEAQSVHRQCFNAGEVQKSSLLSIKTGGCSEDCSYCPQSARYQSKVDRHGLLPLKIVVQWAKKARSNGSTRFCMGAAWRQVPEGPEFDRVLEMVRTVTQMGLEACCTLGMLTLSQARRLKRAGLHSYNHNLDTSPEFYGKIITTRTYKDRLKTLAVVRKAGIQVCSGGIVGLGESVKDRVGLLQSLACQKPHPESVPINLLVRIKGTPLERQKETSPLELIRTISTARIIMPKSVVRLSAGRDILSDEAHALAFLAGANSIFSGDKLLTASNKGMDADRRLFELLGLKLSS